MSSADAVREEYSGLAGGYDRRWCRYIAESVGRTIEATKICESESVLDVGCGTGELLARLRSENRELRLVGLDCTGEMLEVAAAKLLGEKGVGEKDKVMGLVFSRAEEIPLSDESFDVVVSTSSLHYFSDPALALVEMRRVLRKRGRLVITDWCRDFISLKCIVFGLRLFGHRGLRVFTEAELKELMKASGFFVIETDSYKIDPLWGLMTVRAIKP